MALLQLGMAMAEGPSVRLVPSGAYSEIVVERDGASATMFCEGTVVHGRLAPTILESGDARFVCYVHGKGNVVRRDASGWKMGPAFDEIAPEAIVLGGKDFYRARRGNRWYAVWGTQVSDPHTEIRIDFECDADSWVNDVHGVPLYSTRDDDGWRVYVWGKPPSSVHPDEPDGVCGWKKDDKAHFSARGCPTEFPYCTVP